MKMPNWAKVLWWIVLVGFFAYLFRQRYDFIINGNTTSTDIVILLMLIALLVIPLFQEFSIFGVSFKKEIDSLKKDVEKQIISLKSEIRNVVNIYPNGIQPTDAELPRLRKMVDEAVRDAVKGKTIECPPIKDFKTPDDTQFLFAIRYQIERAVRQISIERGEEPTPNSPALKELQRFKEYDLVTIGLYNSIREVYSICSAAIHGENVSEAGVKFVRDVAPELIAALETIASMEMEHKS